MLSPSQTVKFHQRQMEFFGYFSLFTVLKYLCKRKFSFFLGSLTVCLKISKPPPETVDSNSMCFSPHPHPLYEVCDQRFHNFSKVLLAPRSWSSPHSAFWSPSQLAPFSAACARFVSRSWRGRVGRLLDQPGTLVGLQRQGCSKEDGSGGGWGRSRRRAA